MSRWIWIVSVVVVLGVAGCPEAVAPSDLSSSIDLRAATVSCGPDLSACAQVSGVDGCWVCAFAAGTDVDGGTGGQCMKPCSTTSLNPSGACSGGLKCVPFSDPGRTVRTAGSCGGTGDDGYCR